MNIGPSFLSLACLATLVISGQAKAENPFASDRSQVATGYARIDGPGGPASQFDRNVRTLDRGDRRSLQFALAASQGFSFALGFSKEDLVYSSPLAPGICQPDARYFFRFQACQLIAVPRQGVVRDKTETVTLDLRYHRSLSTRFHVDAHLGYGRLAWRTRDDVEAIAVGGCLAIDPTAGLAPLDRLNNTVRIPECETTATANVKAGLRGGLQLSYRLAGPVWLAAGYELQRYTWLPYRHLAYNRFRDANGGCTGQGGCDRPEWFGNIAGRYPEQRDHFSAALGTSLGRHFHAALSYEFGGSRDWDVLGARLGWWF